MPRKAKSKTAEKLAKALNFVACATKENMELYKAHARILNGYLIASDGNITAGHPIDEELSCCPHVGKLIAALNRAGKTLAMTETENGRLSVKGDKIRALVPCLPPSDMPPALPDPNIAKIDDQIKNGFAALLPLTVEDGTTIMESSILLRAQSMVATNRTVIFEYWHGIDLPPGLPIPKSAAKAVSMASDKLEGFGFTDNRSVTFWFEGGAWIKTQLYENEWSGRIDDVLATPGNPVDLPKGLFEGIEAVAEFSPDGAVHFHKDKVKSDYANYATDDMPTGATYDVIGLQGHHSFSTKLLKLIKPVCAKLDYTTDQDKATFYGPHQGKETFPRVRGVIMKRAKA